MVYVNEAVQTPYGAGKVVSVRDKDVVVEPLHWRMAGGQKPSFYVSKSDLSTLFTAGDAVKTQFGSGRIKEAREDGIYVIVLNDWKLATGKSPVLYLPVDSFTREPKDVQVCRYVLGDDCLNLVSRVLWWERRCSPLMVQAKSLKFATPMVS